MKPLPPFALLALLVAASSACDSARGDVREWRADDHVQPPNAPPERQRRRQVAENQPGASDTLADIVWAKSCASCHGPSGRGDGPQGAMMKAPDLTRREWQESVTDEQIRATIVQGKGRMPPQSLPPNVVDLLVQRIRARRAR